MINAERAPAGDAQIGRAEQSRQVFGVEAQSLDHEIGVDGVTIARIGFGGAAATRIGRPQTHGGNADVLDRAVLVRSESVGRRQPDERDAFFLGIGDFAARAGHVGAVAAIEAFDRPGPLADGGADAIHRGVAAADDDDIFVGGIEGAIVEVGHRIAKALAVRGGEIIKCLDNTCAANARRFDAARFVNAGRDQDRVMFLA